MSNEAVKPLVGEQEAELFSQIRRGPRLLGPLLFLLTLLSLMLVATVAYVMDWVPLEPMVGLTFAFVGGGVLVLLLVMHRIQKELLGPLAHLREWSTSMRSGDMSVALPSPQEGELAPLADDLRCLCEEFKTLKGDLDSQVAAQTERLAQKNASLKILYDAAATINKARDLDELLLRFLRVLKEMVGARTATVHMAADDGSLRLLASIDLSNRELRADGELPVQLCPCGKAKAAGDILCENNDTATCSAAFGHEMFAADQLEVIRLPLEHHGKTLGVYHLYLDHPGVTEREDIMQLVDSIGSQLAMAVDKSRVEDESKHVEIMEERSTFANELHDSLAQTLASMRFQMRILHDIIGERMDEDGRRQFDQLHNSLGEANAELRGLIAQFRAPLDQRGLDEAVKRAVDRFRNATGITVFYQQEYEWTNLPVDREMQVVRIVQECLANVRKHADAQFVRVLLRARPGQPGRVLVEDDGKGFTIRKLDGHPGEHVGLSIMQERARRLGGEFRIESEPGEGTRVELSFTHPRCSQPVEG